MPTYSAPEPVIVTDRLTLVPPAPSDFADSASMWAEAEVVRHIGGRPSTPEEVWSRLLRYAGLWTLSGFGYWTVRETVSGRFVGEVGLAEFRRDLSPSFEGAPETGWALAGWAHGRGFGREAVEAVLAWSDARLTAPRTVCLIDPDNAASIRLAHRLGYKEFARGDYRGRPSLLMERSRGGEPSATSPGPG